MSIKRGQNEGSVRQRKDGTWEARYTIGKDASGRQKQKSVYGKTRKEVSEKLAKALNEINTGTFIEEHKITLYEWLSEWIILYKKNNIRKSTFETHSNTISKHIKDTDLGNTVLSKLKSIHFQKLYVSKLNDGLSPSTIKRMHVILKNALKQAVNTNILTKNPLDNVSPPAQIQPEIKVMSIDEQKQFIEALDDEYYRLAFLLTIHTGLRLGELLALRWKDIDFDKKILTVRCSVRRVSGELLIQEPKSKNSRRNIPLLKNILAELTTLKGSNNDPNGIVFTNPYGFITEPRYFTEQFKKILKKAKLDNSYNFHSLRHAFATRLIEAGENAKIVADLLGHSNVSFTLNTYAHALPEKKHSAIEKLRKIFENDDEKTD